MDEIFLALLTTGVTVRTAQPEVARVVRALWSPFLVDGLAQPDVTYEVTATSVVRDGEVLRAGTTWTRVVSRLAQDVNNEVLTRPGPLSVHAGVVTDGTRTVAWPAASTVGKSTFTAACLREGWSYVSDEALVLQDEKGGVVPYPRPLGLCGDARERFGTPSSVWARGELLVPPAELPLIALSARPRLTDLLLLDRQADAPALALTPVPRVEAAHRLLLRSFNATRDPVAAVAFLTALLPRVRVWRAQYAEAWLAAPLLRRALQEAAP